MSKFHVEKSLGMTWKKYQCTVNYKPSKVWDAADAAVEAADADAAEWKKHPDLT